jgi:large subunit ribosomal protein L13
MRTSMPKAPAPQWFLLDAEGQTAGRVAARVAVVLRGKHQPQFSPHRVGGDHVVVINAGKLKMLPAKFRRKTYFKHTGYLGHLRATPLREMFEERPTEVIRKAIFGMLPDNRLRAKALKHLHIFAGSEHEHAAQKPVPFPLS